jgi:hypothetical protein
MNDDELITMVRKHRTNIQMTTPVEEILSRGRTMRARRRIPGMAGAVAVAAAGALAVTGLLPGGQQASHQSSIQLTAAWTVTRQADGTIFVTIRELRDPAGLQARLRADGVPASVAFPGQRGPSCQPTNVAKERLSEVYQLYPGNPSPRIAIHPSALPKGVGVLINSGYTPSAQNPAMGKVPAKPAPGTGPARAGGALQVQVGLVKTSPQCTGS